MEKNLYLTKDKEGVLDINYRTSWNIYPKILKKIKIKKGEKILDAGCGHGEFSKWIKNTELTGVDFRKDLVNKAKKGDYQKVILGDIEKLKLKNKEFNKSFSIQVFQYLKNPKKAFEELLRVTENKIIISVPNFNWLKLKSFFNKKWKMQYEFCVKKENYTNEAFLRNIGKEKNIKIKIVYFSNKMGILRNWLGKYLASEVVAIYDLK